MIAGNHEFKHTGYLHIIDRNIKVTLTNLLILLDIICH